MDEADDEVWQTLARVYVAIFACGVCIPLTASAPVVAGFDSVVPTLAAGTVGLGVAVGVTLAADAQLAAVTARRVAEDLSDPDPSTDPAGDSARS
jgi:hypothetical protein